MEYFVVVHWNVNDAAPIPSWQRLGGGCDVPTTLLLFNCVFAYVNDKFTYFFVCALLFGFLMIEPLLR